MWVIKLGGSVTHHDSLLKWLQLVVRWGDGKVIIVPGGGVYADAVREFQQIRERLPDGHITDVHAHALAIYAMDQMARSLVAMVPELTLVRNPLEIAERGWQHRGLVWLPSEMALNPELWAEMALPENWEITSDSLAAWLACQLEASHLLLVKSEDSLLQQKPTFDLAALQAQGIVDAGLSSILPQATFQTWVMHQSHVKLFEQGLAVQALSGKLVHLPQT
ncbi:MAG: amino acid kinase family protein [Methylophilus sp.]|uniref:amino acid kinase family protein n=1 Tax=Methylophilus sp. TaxID=29541 RepID=UPI003F9EE21A